MKRILLACIFALIACLGVLATTTTQFTVSGLDAYGYYMPPGHALRQGECKIRVMNADAAEVVIRSEFLRCQVNQAWQEQDPRYSTPIQWDDAHVRMLPKAPR